MREAASNVGKNRKTDEQRADDEEQQADPAVVGGSADAAPPLDAIPAAKQPRAVQPAAAVRSAPPAAQAAVRPTPPVQTAPPPQEPKDHTDEVVETTVPPAAQAQSITWHDAREWAALLVSGIATGWMVGMTILPMVGSILTSLLAMATGVAAVLAGLRSPAGAVGARKGARVRPEAVAALSLGLALGASFGLYARTHEWLGNPLPGDQSEERQQARRGLLYAELDSAVCDRLAVARSDDAQLRSVAMASLPRQTRARWRHETDNFNDLVKLRELVDDCHREVRQRADGDP